MKLTKFLAVAAVMAMCSFAGTKDAKAAAYKEWDIVKFGHYPRKENFRIEKVCIERAGRKVYYDKRVYETGPEQRWIVLKIDNTNNKVLLISNDLVECRPLNDDVTKNSLWVDSDLKNWLNGEFVKRLCPDFKESELILETSLDTKDAEKKIKTKVFCLSAEEADLYFGEDGFRTADASQYATEQRKQYALDSLEKAKKLSSTEESGAPWLLRSPGKGSNRIAYVDEKGEIQKDGITIRKVTEIFIRPAMWVSLDAPLTVVK